MNERLDPATIADTAPAALRPAAAARLAVVDASLKRLRPAQRVLAMGERRALFAQVSGLDSASAKFAVEHLRDAKEKLGLSERAIQLDLQLFDQIDSAVLELLSSDTARKANKIAVLRDELKDIPRGDQLARAREIIAAPAKARAQRHRGTLFEELKRLYRSYDDQESVQMRDATLFAEFLIGELGGA
jgi:hypothetical protein